MFAPDSSIRRVHAEGVIILGGGRALLMQVAHPLVARGVTEHSEYRRDRVGRLLRTLQPMYAITFGTPEEVRAAAERIRHVHAGVVGRGYRADDLDLLLWVLGTLTDTALLMHRRFVGPLPRSLAEAYYQDMTRIGEALGLPREAQPDNLEEFEAYMAQATERLVVSDEARTIARTLFAPLPDTPWLTPGMPVARELTVGLLPSALRRQYGFAWGPTRAATLEVASEISRLVLPRLPRSLRLPPPVFLPASMRRVA